LLELGEDLLNTARAHLLLAFIANERGRGDEALDSVARGLALIGDEGGPVEAAKFRLEEARALVLLGRGTEAAATAMTVQGLLADAEPDDAGRAFTVLGDVYRQVGDTARAREIWELAAELLEREPNPYIGDVYERLGTLLEEEGRTAEALQMMKQAYGARQRSTAH
jgi:tetratricopeptide (TPR) repeat protein